jgi:hypothetical protein
MTERPTEQTQGRVTQAEPRPVLPPMPREDTSSSNGGPSLSERLQQKLSAVRQVTPPETTPDTNRAATDQTSVRPAVREPEPQVREDRPAASAPAPAPASSSSTQTQRTGRTQRTRATRPSRQKRPPRRARLRLTRVDPWSVMKTAFLLSIALGVVTIVSVLMVWSVLGAAGVWDSINTTVRDIVGDQADSPFTIQDYLGTDRVIGFTMLVAVIDVVLLTAVATLGAFLYNMSAALLGGIDITLVEDER